MLVVKGHEDIENIELEAQRAQESLWDGAQVRAQKEIISRKNE